MKEIYAKNTKSMQKETLDKKIKVLIEIPSKWVDLESNEVGLLMNLHPKIESMVRDAVVEKVLQQMEVPKIEISKEELKEILLDKLAERVIYDYGLGG